MERWINALPAACGICAGLLIGTGHHAQGSLIALLGVAAVWALRARNQQAHDS